MSELSHGLLRRLLSYDAATGIFTWASRDGRRSPIRIGDVAGCVHDDGYRSIQIERRLYHAHRLAWLYMTGKWPTDKVDHVNGIRDDNRWANLREATPSFNQENRRSASANNKTGFLGVVPVGRKFEARIKAAGKHRYLGTFATPELAHAAYVKAKRVMHAGCTI